MDLILFGPSLLKSCRQVLAPSLANIYNESLESGEVPDIYKLAHITPVYKSGSPHEVSNYRPISLLPVASKVLERLILSQCKSYFNGQPERGLPSEQFAYRRNHSCDDLLTIVINDWQRAIDKQKITGVVFVDVRKAFDSVNHQTLLCDLFSCGICSMSLKWFCSFLENRWQAVTIGAGQSVKAPCQQGVPQGSVLGPFLFSLYLRDLPTVISSNEVKLRLFADDICIYCSGDDLNHVVSVLELSLEEIVTWLSHKSLKVNCTKSEVMFVRSQRVPAPKIAVRCDGEDLKPVSQVK